MKSHFSRHRDGRRERCDGGNWPCRWCNPTKASFAMATVSSRENPEAYFNPIRSRLQDVLGDALDALCLTQPGRGAEKALALVGQYLLDEARRSQSATNSSSRVAAASRHPEWSTNGWIAGLPKINDLVIASSFALWHHR